MNKHRYFTLKKLRNWIIVLGLVVMLPVIVNLTTPIPGALLARFLIGLHSGTTPPADYLQIQQQVKVTRDVAITAPGVPRALMDIYAPTSLRAGSYPIVLWVHGGGFVGSGKDDTRVYMTLLAQRGYVVASLDFSKPPEARYPVPIRQANAALRYLSQYGGRYQGDPSRFFIAGNSSGAQIAGQTIAVETDPRLARAMHLQAALRPGMLRGGVLNCGAYDMETFQKVRFAFLRVGMWSYTGYRNWMDFPDIDQMSTVHHITAHYPPVFITAGDADPLEPQSLEFAASLQQRSVPVTTQFWHASGRNLGHDYQFQLDKPEAKLTLTNTLTFLRAHSGEATK